MDTKEAEQNRFAWADQRPETIAFYLQTSIMIKNKMEALILSTGKLFSKIIASEIDRVPVQTHWGIDDRHALGVTVIIYKLSLSI